MQQMLDLIHYTTQIPISNTLLKYSFKLTLWYANNYPIQVIATKDNNYSWRKAPKSEYCIINATWQPIPPSPVPCINSSRTGNNTYTIAWCPSQEAQWMLLSYQIELRGVNRTVYATVRHICVLIMNL